MKWLLFVYFVLSGVTWVAGEAGEGVTGRVALPDLFMLLLAAYLLVTQRRALRAPRLALATLALLVAAGPGIMLSDKPTTSLLEWIVHGYSLFGFLVLYNLLMRLDFEGRVEMLTWWARAGVLLALVGIYDLVAATIGLPGIAASLGQAPAAQGGLVGTFRNTGQAGSFLVTVLAVALPLHGIVSGRRRRMEVAVIVAVLILGLVLSVKRAALAALLVGIVIFMARGVLRRDFARTARVLLLAAMLLVPTFGWFMVSSDSFRYRIVRKLTGNATQSVSNFAESNVAVAQRQFAENPFTGAGLGSITDVGGGFEIHSTYLNVPASMGLLGVIAYLWLVWELFRGTTRARNPDPRARRFAAMFLPMLLGLMVSYAYTNHLRKREFWITAAVVTALLSPELARRRPEALEPVEDEDALPDAEPEAELAWAGPPWRG